MSQIPFYFAVLVGIFPILSLKFKKKEISSDTYFIEPFLWLIILSDLYELIVTRQLKFSSELWFRSYLLLEFSTLFYFFRKLLKGNYKAFLISYGILYLMAFITSLFFWNEWDKLKTDSFLSVLEIIFVYCSSILWFKDIFMELQEKSLLSVSVFYFLSGFILYFSGTIFLFLVSDQIKKHNLGFEAYWNLNIFFNIVLRFLLIIGIWKGCKK